MIQDDIHSLSGYDISLHKIPFFFTAASETTTKKESGTPLDGRREKNDGIVLYDCITTTTLL